MTFAPHAFITQFYILLIPFTNLFALSPVLPLPLVFLVFATMFAFVNGGVRFQRSDMPMACTIIFGCIGMLSAMEFLGEKNANHLAAIIASVFLYLVVARTYLFRIKSIETIGKAMCISMTIASAFLFAEFYFRNWVGLDIREILPGESRFFEATVFGLYYRPRGFATEPANMALFFELSLPLSLLYMRNKARATQAAFYGFNCAAFMLLFSAAGVTALAVASVATIIFMPKKSDRKKLAVAMAAILVLAIAQPSRTEQFLENVLYVKASGMLEQIAGAERLSGNDRGERYLDMMALSAEAPLGIGWGTASQLSSNRQLYYGTRVWEGFTSFYGEVLVAGGFPALVSLLIFLLSRLRLLRRLGTGESRIVFFSLSALCFHYIFVSDYYYPMIWFALAMADYLVLVPQLAAGASPAEEALLESVMPEHADRELEGRSTAV